MKCMFLRRGAPPGPPLRDVFANLSRAEARDSRDAATTATISISASEIPETGKTYLFAVFNGSLSIWEFNGRTINTTPLFAHANSNSYAGLYCKIGTFSNAYRLYNDSSWYATGSGEGTPVYGGLLLLVTFTEAYNDVAGASLSKMKATTLAARNSSSRAAVSVPVSTCLEHKLVLVQISDELEIWENDTTTITRIVHWVDRTGGSIDGSNLVIQRLDGYSLVDPYGYSVLGLD